MTKFGILHLYTKFHQNLCSRFVDMAYFRPGMVSKNSAFHLTVHITHVFSADESLLLVPKIGFLSKLCKFVGRCGPNGSGDMAFQS